MFYLPLFVNRRRYHYCRLFPRTAREFPFPFEFIVEHHPGYQPVLLRLSKGMSFLSGRGNDHDIALDDRKLLASSQFQADQQTLTIEFKRGEVNRTRKAEQLNAGLKDAPYEWQSQDGHLFLRYQGKETNFTLKLLVILHHESESCEGEVVLHIGESHQTFDAVFDFGSEASQIAFKQRSQESHRDKRMNVMDRLLFDFYAPALNDGRLKRKAVSGEEGKLTPWNVDRERYYQFDPEDQKLYRSSFMVRRSYSVNGSATEAISAAPFQEGNREWVSILGDTYDPRLFDPRNGDGYELIPNLKLAELGFIADFPLEIQGRLAHFSDPSVHEATFRRLMNEFLHLLLAEVASSHPSEQRKLMRLTLLVPNIYSQRRIHQLLTNLQQDFDEIRTHYDYGFSGLEVQTLSESDASFLGLLSDASVSGIRQHELKAGQHYLIIDIGKGTTDLSIVQVGEERNQFSSVFRSGFAGAGNAMTYAFVETLAAITAGDKIGIDRAEAIHQILDAEVPQKLELMRWVEKLKQRYSNPEQRESRLPYSELEALRELKPNTKSFMGDLNRVLEVDFYRKAQTIDDYFGFISETVKEIISRTIELIRRSGVDKFPVVILSGRGFLLPDLRDGMKTELEATFEVGRFLLEERKLKTSCLYGPLNYPTGTNKNSDLVGTPVVTERRNFPDVKGLFSKRKRAAKSRTYTEADLNSDEFYLQGQSLDLEQQRITVSGRELMLPGTLLAEGAPEINLLFAGHGFLARTPQGCVELQFGHEGSDNPLSDTLAWKSLFPHAPGAPRLTRAQGPAPAEEAPEVEKTPEEPVPTNSEEENYEMLSIANSEPVVQAEVKEEAAVEKTPEQVPEDDMWDYL